MLKIESAARAAVPADVGAIGMAYIVMGYIVMACIFMGYIVMACAEIGAAVRVRVNANFKAAVRQQAERQSGQQPNPRCNSRCNSQNSGSVATVSTRQCSSRQQQVVQQPAGTSSAAVGST